MGTVKQTTFKVELKKLDVQTTVDFLYTLETSGYPLAVQSARFKTLRSGDEKLLTLTLEVVSYALVGGSE